MNEEQHTDEPDCMHSKILTQHCVAGNLSFSFVPEVVDALIIILSHKRDVRYMTNYMKKQHQ